MLSPAKGAVPAIRVGSAGRGHVQVAYIPKPRQTWTFGKPHLKLLWVECTRGQVQDRLLRFLRKKKKKKKVEEACVGCGEPPKGQSCSANPSGYHRFEERVIRPAHDLSWVRQGEARGPLTHLEAAAILWSSALRIAEGMRPVKDLAVIREVTPQHVTLRPHDPHPHPGGGRPEGSGERPPGSRGVGPEHLRQAG